MENYLSKLGLHILNRKFFDKMYILYFGFKKNTIENQKFNFAIKICEIQNMR